MQAYNKIDQQIHLLCQIIAKVNRTYLPKKEDDSHTNLYFDSLSQRILGRWIEQSNPKILLSLNLAATQFEWLDDGLHKVAQHPILGKTSAEIEQDIEQHLSELKLDPKGFTAPLHFDIPQYPFTQKAFKDFNEEALLQWQYFRQLANDACSTLLGHLQADEEVRIWPHHFDTGIYVTPNEKVGIGFGLAVSDTISSDAYFYLTGYDLQNKTAFKNGDTLPYGKWVVSGHFSGAVLPISQLEEGSIQQRKEVYAFMEAAARWFLNC